MNGNTAKGKGPADGVLSPRSRPSALPSKPTVSLDKLTINGTTTPPLIGTPPLARALSRSPSNLSATPPRKSAGKSPTPDDRDADFRGLFTPSYLPLLESRERGPTQQRRTAPPQPKRALSSPSTSSSSLPSALRTASGTPARKRKHVTFQLADTAIVEPSSSHGELPSPQLQISQESIDQMMEDAARNEAAPLANPSASAPPSDAGFSGGLSSAEDGGSGVGFFELDEELSDLGERSVDHGMVSSLPEPSAHVIRSDSRRRSLKKTTSRSLKILVRKKS